MRNTGDAGFLPSRHPLRDQEHELAALHPAAIDYEARRQIAIVEGGGTVVQETRLYDPDKGETRSMRSKEEAHDYRYFPDPDLLPLEIEQAWVDEIAAPAGTARRQEGALHGRLRPERLRRQRADRRPRSAALLRGRRAASGDGKLAANWVINELFGRLKKEEHSIAESPVTPAQLGAIITLIKSGDISGKIAKDVFEIVYTEGGDPAQIVEARGMKQVTDTGAIEAAVDEIIAANPAQVEKAKEPQARRLVRGPGDEGHGRQGQPQGGERDRDGETGASPPVSPSRNSTNRKTPARCCPKCWNACPRPASKSHNAASTRTGCLPT
jgi:Glu-tRNA(Gln) amidotransferase subunit E-like FAD-binding protein